LDEQRRASGFDQAALDEAACKGFANGAFEELGEDVPAVDEEFYPGTGSIDGEATATRDVTLSLRGKLDDKVARLGHG